MLTKREVARIFREGTREEQLKIVYGTHYAIKPKPWNHYFGFWDDPEIALKEFRDCILPGYAAEERVERDYLIPAKGKGVWKDYTMDFLNDYHFMEGDPFIREESELNQPDGHLWDMRGNELTFDIKCTCRNVTEDRGHFFGGGLVLDPEKAHNADWILLYQRNEQKLYFYSIETLPNGMHAAKKVFPDYQFEKERKPRAKGFYAGTRA